MEGMVPGRRLTREDLQLVIQRAAEIEEEPGSALPELSEEDVVRIASEVGLSEGSVRRALAEHFAAASGAGLLIDRGWAAKVCGPGLVKASRSVAAPASEVQETVESHFQTHESLRPVRRRSWGSLWEPEPGVVASIMRSVDLHGRGYDLAKKAKAVELQVVPLGEEWTHVALTADLTSERAGWFWALGVVTLGLGIWFARMGYLKSVEKMRLCLEGLLDRLEHGEPLESPPPSWRDLLK